MKYIQLISNDITQILDCKTGILLFVFDADMFLTTYYDLL